jgi:hypothetical protein
MLAAAHLATMRTAGALRVQLAELH